MQDPVAEPGAAGIQTLRGTRRKHTLYSIVPRSRDKATSVLVPEAWQGEEEAGTLTGQQSVKEGAFICDKGTTGSKS